MLNTQIMEKIVLCVKAELSYPGSEIYIWPTLGTMVPLAYKEQCKACMVEKIYKKPLQRRLIGYSYEPDLRRQGMWAAFPTRLWIARNVKQGTVPTSLLRIFLESRQTVGTTKRCSNLFKKTKSPAPSAENIILPT